MACVRKPQPAWIEQFGVFCEELLKHHFTPLTIDTDLSFESWLANRPYPEWRKKELREVYEGLALWDENKKLTLLKCFMKDETYTEYKHGRGIWSRSDVFKVLFGPLVAKIEEQLYQHPAFIKHIPVKDRPGYIEKLFEFASDTIAGTDFTSFEASFVKKVMKACDQKLFQFFTQYLDNPQINMLYKVPMGLNECVFKLFTVWIVARRMSGEMNTSSCNGFANWALFSYFYYKITGRFDCPIVVEGDDGLMKGDWIKQLIENDFRKLGFEIKFDKYSSVSEASFCGIIYDPIDRINVTDPREVLASFGWCSRRYAGGNKKRLRTLLRCKSLSYLHQYPGCPIIQALALYGLRITRSYDVRGFLEKDRVMSLWEREQVKSALLDCPVARPVGCNTRLLIERKYKITVEEQLMIEQYLHKLETVQILNINLFQWPDSWVHYSDNYVRLVNWRDYEAYFCENVNAIKETLELALYTAHKWR